MEKIDVLIQSNSRGLNKFKVVKIDRLNMANMPYLEVNINKLENGKRENIPAKKK